MRKHLVALLAVLMLLMAAIPMQALADEGITTIYTQSTQKIQKGDTGKVSLKIVAEYATERVVHRIYDEDGNVEVGPVYSEDHDTTIGLGRAYTIYIDTSSLAVGDYTIEYWIQRKTSGGYIDTGSYDVFGFEVIKNVCSGSHTMEQTSINKEPTCEVPGIALYTCSKCGLTAYEEIPMEHTYGSGTCTRPPTTTVPGIRKYTCSTCGAVKNELISVEEAIKIVTQPKKASAYDGKSATVSVKATGKDLKYQWQYKNAGSSTWNNSTSGTSASYATLMNASRNGRYVRCKITNKYGSVEYTNAVKLTTKFPAKITTQPKSKKAYEDEVIKLTIGATGDGLKYAWYYKNPSASSYSKSSVTTATCELKMTDARDGRKMYCIVTDKYGNEVKSKTVTLSMKHPVKITASPKSVSSYADKTVKFTVKATGDGLKYQWQYKNAGSSKWNTGSSTTSTYSVKMTAARDGRQIRCKVTDAYGNVKYSKTATLSLKAMKITTQPKSKTVDAGERAKFTVKATGDGLKYQWQYKNAGSSKWVKGSSTSTSYSVLGKASRDGRKIRCKITDTYGNVLYSNTVTLNVD